MNKLKDKDFNDVEQYVKKCKIRNCRHQNEPDCAVKAAIMSGELSEDKLKRYVKLQKANIFTKDKKIYNKDWNNFLLNLSRFSKKNNSYKNFEIDSLEQETSQLEEELCMNMEDGQ